MRDANYDRLEHIANYDTLLRQMLGVEQTPWVRRPRSSITRRGETTSR